MDQKLTLKMDGKVIEEVKRYAHGRGQSVSKLAEDYFRRLASPEKPAKTHLRGAVAELAGLLKARPVRDPRSARREHLDRKHS